MPTDHSIICQKHFSGSDFQKSSLERLRRDLVPGAVPSIFDFVRKSSERVQQQKIERADRKVAGSDKRQPLLPAEVSAPLTEEADEPEIFLQVDFGG